MDEKKKLLNADDLETVSGGANCSPQYIYVSSNDCIDCGACIDECPDSIIEMFEGKARYKADECCQCNACRAICPMMY